MLKVALLKGLLGRIEGKSSVPPPHPPGCLGSQSQLAGGTNSEADFDLWSQDSGNQGRRREQSVSLRSWGHLRLQVISWRRWDSSEPGALKDSTILLALLTTVWMSLEGTKLGKVARAITLVLGGWRHSPTVTAHWVASLALCWMWYGPHESCLS